MREKNWWLSMERIYLESVLQFQQQQQRILLPPAPKKKIEYRMTDHHMTMMIECKCDE